MLPSTRSWSSTRTAWRNAVLASASVSGAETAHTQNSLLSNPVLKYGTTVSSKSSHVIEGVARTADCGEHAKQSAREPRPDAVGYSWAGRSDFKVFLDAPVVIVISGHA